MAMAALLVLLMACQPETSKSKDSQAAREQQRQKNITAIEDSINNSHAKLASNRDDVCPKLLQKALGNQSIERTAEVMVDDYCDYYLYPQSGQTLSAVVNDSRIEAMLVVPKFHDFANGSYHVTSYDKHVIRLAYNGISYKPDRLQYDVTVQISN